MPGRLLVVGCGDIGQSTGVLLANQGWEVFGLCRRPERLPTALRGLRADVTQPDSLAVLQSAAYSHVLFTLAPDEYSAEAYRSVYYQGVANVLAHLTHGETSRVIFASSTAVYHQNDGSWVDENSPVLPRTFSGQTLLETEGLLSDYPMPSTSVRFGGIYGPGRSRLIDRLRRGLIVEASCAHYSNRIHSADCAGVLAHLIAADARGDMIQSCYLGVDGRPAPLREVCEWLAQACGLDVAAMREEPAPTRGGNKRCANQALQASGYRFQYEDYRAGFSDLLTANAARE